MTQVIEKVLEEKRPKIEQAENDQMLGDLNPRYFEEAMTLKEAQQKVYSSTINLSCRYNVFRAF
ncbi:MAG: hypothetical protein ACFE94_07020 [Candidatus Hodarchaeota archaeon]